MISSVQSTGSDVFTYPKDRREILDAEWIVNFGQGELSGSGSEITHHSEDVNSAKVDRTAASTLTVDSEVLIDTFHNLGIKDQVFSATFQAPLDHETVRFMVKALDSSTSVIELATDHLRNRFVNTRVQQLFSLATFLDLEPGMTNEFSEGLEMVIEHFGDKALQVIEELVLGDDVKSSVAMEALQYVGNTDSDNWHDERRKMLERCLLESPSVWVRDGAGLGLASLDDPNSLPALEKAILNETSGALKEDLTLVLHQLRDTLQDQ